MLWDKGRSLARRVGRFYVVVVVNAAENGVGDFDSQGVVVVRPSARREDAEVTVSARQLPVAEGLVPARRWRAEAVPCSARRGGRCWAAKRAVVAA